MINELKIFKIIKLQKESKWDHVLEPVGTSFSSPHLLTQCPDTWGGENCDVNEL